MYARSFVILTMLCIANAAGASGNVSPGSCGDKYTQLSGTGLYLVEEPSIAPLVLLYAEANGQDDLQRGGADLRGTPDPCQAVGSPDVFIGLL